MKLDVVFKTIAAALFTVFLIVLMALAAEELIRYRQSQRMGGVYVIENLYQEDPVLKLRLPKPGLKTETISIDSHGFRNDELVTPKPDHLVRIAYLGASTTFCAENSSNENTWPHVTTALLKDKFPKDKFDYINAGVPGYVSETSLRHLKSMVAPFQPDIITIYQATNDLSQELRDLARTQGIYNLSNIEEKSWLADHSVLWDLVEKNLRIINAQNNSKTGQKLLKFDVEKVGLSYKKDLNVLVKEAKKIAPMVVLVTFSVQMRIEQNDEQKLKAAASSLYYMPFMNPNELIKTFNRYNNITREVAKQNNVLLVDAAYKIPGDEQNFNDSVHFKDLGSKNLASIIAPVIAESNTFKELLEDKNKARNQ